MKRSHGATYVLESESEFARLEKQARSPGYSCQQELADLVGTLKPATILDAGCGSGVVARYLAGTYPDAQVHGCDSSELRVRQARLASLDCPNLTIERAGLEKLPYPDGNFELIVCRFVLQHLRPSVRVRVLRELFRCLRPGGTLRIIETDGLFFNVGPLPRKLAAQLETWRKDESVDMFVARKLPTLLLRSGFSPVDWEIQAISFKGPDLQWEREIYEARFAQAEPLFARVLGSAAKARRFAFGMLRLMRRPGAVVFHNKFVITASKERPPRPQVRLVL